ncbi:MAG TPA: DUF1015 domain-containing protein [Terriglobales bacterium]|jgi:uncharacterized protein (DUF1015 family)|nr:DUF1015 domain-containing protein [Terriglobales bacterium]
MAEVFPFAALRYDPARVELAQVMTQPYDKITPAMQERYYRASPYNLVRVILGKPCPGDQEGENVYTRAASSFAQWRREGILQADPEPGFYAYAQRFTLPGEAGEVRERRGFIGLGQIEDYSAKVVFRHEQTLSRPKADRLNLLRATRAHFGQIFMLYCDPQRALDQLVVPGRQPDIEVQDEYGVLHRMWRVTDAAAIAAIRARMREQKLVIADGHHRYETALEYRNERRAQAGKIDPLAPYERVMMTFVNSHGTGIVILPTHRVVHGLPGFQVSDMIVAARPFFAVEDLTSRFDPQRPLALLPAAAPGETALLAVTRRQAFLLRAAREARHPALERVSPGLAELDVVRLHRVLLETALGISAEAVRDQTHVTYLREAGEAVERVRSGQADVAFLMNPVGVEQVTALALAGEVLPQKSTDFYPKLLSGLAIYALE